MKKHLLKMLAACLPVRISFIVSAMMLSVSAKAQIIYTDVIPDTTFNVSGDTCQLDLDNNGQADYKLCQFTFPYYCDVCYIGTQQRVAIFPMATNVIADWTWLSQQWPQCLEFGQVIDAGLSMSETNHTIIYSQPGGGCAPLINCVPPPAVTWALAWVLDPGPRYLGLRFDIAGATHYGWARLRVPNAGEFTLMDYAYNSIPNQPILAGQTSTTGINENSLASSINLFPNPALNHLTIILGSSNKKVEVTIADITGNIIYTKTEYETNKIQVNTNEFSEGVYIVQIQAAGFIGTKKLVIEK
ncbi:MAG: T9SS type A sorting domain-containing protein [Bacteroidetes bacterium]|nr:T9SS type A sorting domain-containing protein [Bacteroidota bacterium]